MDYFSLLSLIFLPLFRQELIKYTPERHPDHANLNKALQCLKETVDAINTKSQSVSMSARVNEIATKLEQPKTVPYILYLFLSEFVLLTTAVFFFFRIGPIFELVGRPWTSTFN